jgi:hypothetical protein
MFIPPDDFQTPGAGSVNVLKNGELKFIVLFDRNELIDKEVNSGRVAVKEPKPSKELRLKDVRDPRFIVKLLTYVNSGSDKLVTEVEVRIIVPLTSSRAGRESEVKLLLVSVKLFETIVKFDKFKLFSVDKELPPKFPQTNFKLDKLRDEKTEPLDKELKHPPIMPSTSDSKPITLPSRTSLLLYGGHACSCLIANPPLSQVWGVDIHLPLHDTYVPSGIKTLLGGKITLTGFNGRIGNPVIIAVGEARFV